MFPIVILTLHKGRIYSHGCLGLVTKLLRCVCLLFLLGPGAACSLCPVSEHCQQYQTVLLKHLSRLRILPTASTRSMQPLYILNTLSLLRFSAFTSAHGVNTPAPRGWMSARPRHTIEGAHGYSELHIQRRDTGKKCGPGVGFCGPGDWYVHGTMLLDSVMKADYPASCSPVGFCGRGYQYCASPNCQIDYSSGCDASMIPLGEPTLNVSRPLIGNVSYDGAGVEHCKNPGAVALTFDDGPYNYTSHLLDVLAAYGARATFFITGNNLGKGQIDIEETGWPDIIRRMHADGHQVLLDWFSFHRSLTFCIDSRA